MRKQQGALKVKGTQSRCCCHSVSKTLRARGGSCRQDHKPLKPLPWPRLHTVTCSVFATKPDVILPVTRNYNVLRFY